MAGDEVKEVQQQQQQEQQTNAPKEEQQQQQQQQPEEQTEAAVGEKRNVQEDQELVRSKRYKTAKERRAHFEKNNTYKISEERPSTGSEDSESSKEPRLPKKKVALLVGYSGTGYQGMQMNPNAKSIESELFQALCKANAISKANSGDPKKVHWMRAARTDKGVHAAGNVVSLKMCLPEGDVVKDINSHLPDQIRVWGYVRVNSAFHAKTGCDSRVYEYLLPTYCFLPPAPKKVGEERGSENDIVMVVDNKEHYIPRSTPEEMENKRKYRIDAETLSKFREALSKFVGTSNYHNYTIGRGFKDKSCYRYIKSIEVSEPIMISDSEWLSVKLHGQSFMLHQIRKMISMAILTVRSGTPLSLIDESFKDKRINIPKAPALGLLLERPVFESYNRKTQQAKARDPTMRQCIDFDEYKDTINEFKQKWIYSKIFEDEQKDAIFDSFLTSVDSQIGPDFKYLNPEGVIPPECLITTKYTGTRAEQEEAKQLEDE